mgnify:CR=1 FL=1
MNICIVIPYFYPAIVYGGPVFSSKHTVQELAKISDNKIVVATTNANGKSRLFKSEQTALNSSNIYINYYNDNFIGRFSFPMMFLLWREIYWSDVVHIQTLFSPSTFFALFYSRIFRKKIVLSPRGSLGEWCLNQGSSLKPIWLKYFIKPLLSNVIWHATAELESNEIKKVFHNADVKIIPNGIDLSAYSDVDNEKDKMFYKKYDNDISCGERIIVSMGRIQKKKGFDILIKSIKNLITSGERVKLFIAGEDEGELEFLESLVLSNELTNNVFFIGQIKDKEKVKFLSNADIFVLPSHNENFGNVYLESLASGTPIIASLDTPWNDVNQKFCGIHTSNEVINITNAIQKILSLSSDKYNEMCINSKVFSKDFQWSSIAKEFHELFKG